MKKRPPTPSESEMEDDYNEEDDGSIEDITGRIRNDSDDEDFPPGGDAESGNDSDENQGSEASSEEHATNAKAPTKSILKKPT